MRFACGLLVFPSVFRKRGSTMVIKLKPLGEQVIVITGASSGIGLATACAAAERGAKVVLTARDEETLGEVARQISDSGGEIAYVAGDVAQREELVHVADVAVERFGGFDTWVNNAGVGLYGRLDEASDQDHRRLFERGHREWLADCD
jgi:NADP-dependent 3-hydroxy acid dehydrogenase YdfG